MTTYFTPKPSDMIFFGITLLIITLFVSNVVVPSLNCENNPWPDEKEKCIEYENMWWTAHLISIPVFAIMFLIVSPNIKGRIPGYYDKENNLHE